MGNEAREKAITRTSVIGIAANVFLVIFKAAAGLVAGSVSIVMDAVNNLTDALSSVITIIGIKLARRSPDEKHPFGYGRIEYFSTIIISLLVLAAGITSIMESVKKIITPQIPDYTTVTLVIVMASVMTKLALGQYVKAQGKRWRSDALTASGADAGFDAILSGATFLGALITLLFQISLDGIIGAVISVFIIKAGMEMLFDSIDHVLGSRPDSEITNQIKETILSIDGVFGAYDLILHNYGPDYAVGSIHVEIPDSMTAADIHRCTLQIQKLVSERFHIFLTVGVYAVDMQDEHKRKLREKIVELAKKEDGVKNVHGVFIDSVAKQSAFDIVTDFTVEDKGAVGERIVEGLRKSYPEYTFDVNYDTNYSD